jgi:predicted P-loop ATPase
MNQPSALALSAQGAEQCRLLWYLPDETVYFRGFYPKTDPRYKADSGRKSEDSGDLTEWEVDGRGIYFVVNGYGHTDDKVKTGRAIFYEHDDLDIEAQIILWQHLELPQPTFQVMTGGKSVHSYWTLDEPISAKEWRSLQSDLLDFADADRSIKNPSRVMRLAGYKHPETGKPAQLINVSEARYSFELLRNLVPKKAEPEPRAARIETPGSFPIGNALAKSNRDFVESGAPEGGRNSTGYKLACDLIGVERWLALSGYTYERSARDLFDQFCDRCNPALGDKEREKIWSQAATNGATPSLSGDKLINCYKGWERKNKPKVAPVMNSNRHKPVDAGGFEMVEPLASDKIQTLETEFENIKTKYESALERVEILTQELEEAEDSDKKQITARLRNAKDILKSLNSSRFNARIELKQLTQKQKGEAETGFAKDFVVIQEKVAERLSYNILERSIYIDDERTQFNSSCLWLYEKTGHLNWNKGDSTLSLVILDFAKKNQFCPVKRYLESIEVKVSHSYLDQCIPYLFGIAPDSLSYPLACATFKAQLVGSVRRIYEPGCHHRLMPILHGQQKKGKSTFLRELYNGFSKAGALPITDKDGALIIQGVWAFEVDECDKLFRTREASSLKSFVSLTEDFFRAPYEKDTLAHPRRAVMWGTTNHQALFSDPTGNTRYPVISMPDGWTIPNQWVNENRGNIWSAALDAYWTGIPNEIPADLEAAIADDSENYIDRDALHDPIERYLETRDAVPVELVEVAYALKFDNVTFNKMVQNRVTTIMRSLGWESRSKYCSVSKKTLRRWEKR